MFTGIVTSKGKILDVRPGTSKGLYLKVAMPHNVSKVKIGASVAHNGVCLTVIDKGRKWLAYDASPETVSCTTISQWKVSDELNIEYALKAGEELGGHIVLGHVDGTTTIESIESEQGSYKVAFHLASEWASFIATKGSIAIDGVSLTINQVSDIKGLFYVMIVPHTWRNTVFSGYEPKHKVNLEIDPIARYIARYVSLPK